MTSEQVGICLSRRFAESAPEGTLAVINMITKIECGAVSLVWSEQL